MNKAAKVFVVDDHPLVSEWLGNLLQQQAHLVFCGEAKSAGTALAAIAKAGADVAIVDLSLKDGSGLDLIRKLKVEQPQVSSIVLSMYDERVYGERTIRAGAMGYIMKQETAKSVVAAIRCVLSGKLYLSESALARLDDRPAPRNIRGQLLPTDNLSNRELEVFEALGRGMGTRQVSIDFDLSIKTVHSYCDRIKEKLHFASGAELIRAAIERNVRSNGD